MEPLIQFFGRLHPMVLHAPIGLLIGLVALEGAAAATRRPLAPSVRGVLAWLAALTAVVTAGSGWLLSREGGYDGQTVQWHQWLGIGVAAVALAAALLQHAGHIAAFRGLLVIAVGAAVPAGHLGASMTHGSDFLTEPFAAHREPVATDRVSADIPVAAGAAASTYATVIAPIFSSRCVSCHSPAKHKGGLALDTPESIARGSDLGSVIIADDGGQSEIARRLRLPLDDEDHMPPRSKPQPTDDQIAAIEAWLNAGASFDAAVEGITPPTGGPAPSEVPPTQARAEPAPPAEAAVAALRDRLVYIAPIRQESTLLVVDFAAVADSMSESDIATLLTPVLEQVADLSLARAKVGDGLMPLIARMPNLTRLNLSATGVSDGGVALLQGHPALKELIVAQTALTDACVPSLARMPALASLYCWKSALSQAGVEALTRRSVIVDLGDARTATVIEADAEAKLSTEAPPAAVANLTPINTVCPVSGSPVDPDFAIVYKGRVIGFCCEHCPSQFWADPAKFEASLPK